RDLARQQGPAPGQGETIPLRPAAVPPPREEDVDRVAQALAAARRPVVILGLDLDPRKDAAAARAFVEALGAPAFVTPKAKGMLSEDHPLFCGVCAGVAGGGGGGGGFGRGE